jgi:hypothetical protein
MTSSSQVLARWLSYAGVLPPWLALLVSGQLPDGWAGFAALSYGAVIASFVCGMHWASYLAAQNPLPTNLLITSNVAALAVWALVLASIWTINLAFAGLVVVLAGLLLIDRQLRAAGAIEPWFWQVRRNASLGLCAGLLVWSLVA